MVSFPLFAPRPADLALRSSGDVGRVHGFLTLPPGIDSTLHLNSSLRVVGGGDEVVQNQIQPQERNYRRDYPKFDYCLQSFSSLSKKER
jgi:hypothetical protein